VISFICRTCGRSLRAKDKYAGRIVECGSCGLRQIVPEDVTEQNDQNQPTIPPSNFQDKITEKAIPYAEPVATYQAPNVIIQMPKDDSPGQKRRKGFECPYCHTDESPIVDSQISTAGWVIFVVLLIACFPLCIIGLFVKESYRRCSACGIRLG
jgi:DNA-directed RNA polymerase subunit M/transcription elongation factor TFIIS